MFVGLRLQYVQNTNKVSSSLHFFVPKMQAAFPRCIATLSRSIVFTRFHACRTLQHMGVKLFTCISALSHVNMLSHVIPTKMSCVLFSWWKPSRTACACYWVTVFSNWRIIQKITQRHVRGHCLVALFRPTTLRFSRLRCNNKTSVCYQSTSASNTSLMVHLIHTFKHTQTHTRTREADRSASAVSNTGKFIDTISYTLDLPRGIHCLIICRVPLTLNV